MVIRRTILLVLFLLIIFSGTALPDNMEPSARTLLIKEQAFWTTIAVGIIVIFLVLISISYDHQKNEQERWVLFLTIIIPIILVTLYIAGTTIYLNQISATKGPVHWHADFELWNCGEKVNLNDPTGFSNRIGNPVLHEHNDDRIHVEGVILEEKDVSLRHFFNTIGGKLTRYTLTIPTEDGLLTMQQSNPCNGKPGIVQLFAYSIVNPDDTDNYIYEQHKVDNYTSYVLSPFSQIPPGDCLIIEFDEEKESTDKLCASYQAAISRGVLHGR